MRKTIIGTAVLGGALCALLGSTLASATDAENPCAILNIPANSHEHVDYDPYSGAMTIGYRDESGDSRSATINVRDAECRSNRSVRAIVDPADASVAAERRAACAAARSFVQNGPANDKERGVSRANAVRVDTECRANP